MNSKDREYVERLNNSLARLGEDIARQGLTIAEIAKNIAGVAKKMDELFAPIPATIKTQELGLQMMETMADPAAVVAAELAAMVVVVLELRVKDIQVEKEKIFQVVVELVEVVLVLLVLLLVQSELVEQVYLRPLFSDLPLNLFIYQMYLAQDQRHVDTLLVVVLVVGVPLLQQQDVVV